AAISLLGHGRSHRAEDLGTLLGLLTPQTPDELQNAAVLALGRLHDERVPTGLLNGWKAYSPSLRSQVLGVLFQRSEWLQAVLTALQRHELPASEIDAARRQALLANKSRSIRAQAARIFAGAVNADRQKVIDSYRLVLGLKGDPRRGLQVFTKNCSTCHRLGKVGNDVGPNLGTVSDKSSDYLLTNILDPNRSVEPRYISYLAELKDGRLLTGVLTSETGPSVTLVSQDGKQHPILRSDLESLTSTGKSLMPEGLEKDVKPQEMADLIAFVRSSGPSLKPKAFAGNKPELVRAAPDGSLVLRSTNCEIYGSSLVLEKQYGNLGYWSSADDQAVWTVDVARPGEYEVWFEYACPAGLDVNRYVLQAGDQRMVRKVIGKGTWDDYQVRKVGRIRLAAGNGQITLKSVGPPRGALFDVKSIRLVPARQSQ
ncbi:MAG TPA: c-type cytochrome, partial [Gemmataceae bacterium]|nr:c-type cytochrome [Gemmataceae bacterium]